MAIPGTEIQQHLAKIKGTAAPLRRQLLLLAVITRMLREGRYWVNRDLDLMVEAPASSLAGEEAHRETVELGEGFECTVLGIEDLLIDRMNACRHWKSEADCEMVELLVARYGREIDWDYLLKRAALQENDTAQEFRRLKAGQG